MTFFTPFISCLTNQFFKQHPHNHSPKRRMVRRSGFTLTELLVVIAVIAMLAALLFPAFQRARESARRTACQSNLKQIALGIHQYVQDYDEVMPLRYSGAKTTDTDAGLTLPPSGIAPASDMDSTPLNWRVLLYPYVKSPQVFACPSNPKREESATNIAFAPAGTPEIPVSYACNYNSGTGLGSFGDETGQDKVTLAQFDLPSQTIAVTETTSPRPDINMDDIRLFGELYAGHTGFTNYLFADGHVKALKPLQTYYDGDKIVNMWHRDHSEFPR